VKKMKSLNNLKVTAASIALSIGGLTLLPSPSYANDFLDFWDRIVTPNFEVIRSETVGRMARQELVGELSAEQLNDYKVEYGGDYHSKVTDWCYGLVLDRIGRGRQAAVVPGITSTWRDIDGRINCFWRRFGSN
jgi:hypothetical protein